MNRKRGVNSAEQQKDMLQRMNVRFAPQCQLTGLSWRKLVLEKIGLSDRLGCGVVELEVKRWEQTNRQRL